MLSPKIKEFLEAGVHFGHQTRRWNPKMKPFIFAARNGIYIIDLSKTLKSLEAAQNKVREVVGRGRTILFVGTKKQAKAVIEEESKRCNGFYVTERWLGGMLTNFDTIKQSIKKLKNIEKMKEDGSYEQFTKKERAAFDKEADRLQKVLGGIKEMNVLPGLVIVVDAKKESIAVAEAHKLGIPIVGILDTNADPDMIDFPIAPNDDAIKSIKILIRELVDASLEARSGLTQQMIEAKLDEDRGRPQAVYTSTEEEASGETETTGNQPV
ncbi:MAG: 30S ribosomal protein S2 [Candidatus Zixiibacteriota bacterium]